MVKFYNTLVTAMLFTAYAYGQSIEVINLQNRISEKASFLTDGYAEKITGEDITYNNLWNSDEKAFLTRATTGEMEISWQSATVKNIQNGSAHFLLLVCLDQANEPLKFNFYINNQHMGYFPNFHEAAYQKELQSGVTLKFSRVGITSWGDGTCLMEIEVPEKLVTINQPMIFKVAGEHAQSNAWFMVFKTKNIVSELQGRVAADAAFAMMHKGNTITLYAPDIYKKKLFTVKVNERNSNPIYLNNLAGETAFEINSKDTIHAVRISCDGKEWVYIPDFNAFRDTTYLVGNQLYKQSRQDNGLYVFSRQYSNAYDLLQAISNSPYRNATIHIMVSSHQDIAWMDTPFRCIETRDKVIVSPALELLEKYPDYHYDIEDALILEEYLERNPQKHNQIAKFLANGQLGIGAAYTQPYEEMQTGEALVRQFYYGKRFLTKNFNGYEPQTYWNVDVPGRTLQMPQILAKSGVKGIQYSRHERGLYRWVAPDSSSVIVFTPGHYSAASSFLPKSPEEGMKKFSEYLHSMPDYRSSQSVPAVIGLLSAEDMSPAHTYYHWMDKFKHFRNALKMPLPQIKHATSDQFFTELMKTNPVLPAIVGERPNLWLYIHGPAHERAITTYREANRKAIFAETFSTIAALLKGSFVGYPKRHLDQMWKDIIYADHGWGGNGGFVTDSLFYARYRRADTTAAEINRNASGYIAGKIKVNQKKGVPIIVFNSLSTTYSSPVKVMIDTQKNPLQNMLIQNAVGETIPHQVTNVQDKFAEIEFIAHNLPSVGYDTYYVLNKSGKRKTQIAHPEQSSFYALSFKNGRLVQITDKELKQDLFDASKFEIGDIFTMQSVGNGAGEFATMQLPTMEGFDKTSNHKQTWKLISTGDVYSLYRCETPFEDATIVRNLKLYKEIKRIDFTSEVLNFTGKHYREFRQAFPMKSKGAVSYEVPFGTVVVGKDEMKGHAGERYLDEAKDIRPRGIANWIGYTDANTAIKLTSSVAVVDYIDPTASPVDNTILQPILFASRRSCHWLGEFYAQAGDHAFEFSLRSDIAGVAESSIQAAAANYKPLVVYNPETYRDAALPETMSFFSVHDKNVSISTIKKGEDDDQVVLRIYNTATDAKQIPVTLKSYFPIERITQTNMLELNPVLLPSTEKIQLGSKAIETFQLKINL